MSKMAFLFVVLFSAFSFAQQELNVEVAPAPEAPPENLVTFDLSWFATQHWINSYQVVIVINKESQTLTLFKQGQNVFETLVSSGRERVEKQRSWVFGHGPKQSYYSSTNVGYFNPTWLSINHKSKLWRSRMPYAVFFDGGIAIHQAPKGTESMLGKPASGGCVRVSPEAAPYIFAEVQATENSLIPKVDKAGHPVLQADGSFEMVKGYSTLVIVE